MEVLPRGNSGLGRFSGDDLVVLVAKLGGGLKYNNGTRVGSKMGHTFEANLERVVDARFLLHFGRLCRFVSETQSATYMGGECLLQMV